ncbi:MAG: protein phosphatase 2C domain-containing protein [Pseudomonadota bacterium]
MASSAHLTFDVATAVALGQREAQEDAIVADFPIGGGLGLVVLADGMGGHNAGDIASKIVVTEVFSELKLRGVELMRDPSSVSETLRKAAFAANSCLASHTEMHPRTTGMGATLVGLVQLQDALFWISIGDSLLYLLRDGKLTKLNQDHSLAPQIDYMVRQGLLTEEAGRNHPDRNCLTSALRGEDIPFIDCPDAPIQLQPNDIVLSGSDGLHFLDPDEIAEIVMDQAGPSADIAAALLRQIDVLGHPDQDNVCLSIVQVGAAASAAAMPLAHNGAAQGRAAQASAVQASTVQAHASASMRASGATGAALGLMNKIRSFRLGALR